MKVLSINSIKARIQNIHPRSRKAHTNTIIGLLIKGGGIFISLLLVPVTIDYLSKDTYGTWLTISSIVTMLTFLDIGIGNGLRNKFSEAVTSHNVPLARGYISTAYILFGSVQVIAICLFLLVVAYIPWQQVFNTTIDSQQLQTVVCITVMAMAVKLVLDILSYALFALQESSLVGFITFLSNILILIGTYTLTKFTSENLIYLATLTAIIPVIVLIVSSLLLYQNILKEYRPSFQSVNLSYAKGLLSIGYKFFIVQIAVIVLFYTDNVIITQLFGPAEVTTYNVAFRYFNAISVLFNIAIGPYWSAFTEAAVKQDVEWMKQAYKYLQKMWLVLVGVIFFMVIVADFVYTIWIGNRVTVPYLLNICMGLFVIISCWNNIMSSISNGLGKIRLQLYYALVAALANIPLSLWLGKEINMGSSGVILSTSCCLLIGTLFGTIQVRKLLFGNAEGIWNK